LNAPEPAGNGEAGVDDAGPVESPEEPSPQHLPPQQARAGMPQGNPQMHPGYMPQTLEQQQALAYQNYVAQQQRSGYPMPPQAGIPQQHSHQA
jgi:pheromone receptor transcription factor